jgi:hypothetical protein
MDVIRKDMNISMSACACHVVYALYQAKPVLTGADMETGGQL